MNKLAHHPTLAAELVDAAACHPLIRKLSIFTNLSADERAAIAEVSARPIDVAAGEDIVRRGDPQGGVRLLLSGFAARYKILEDGRRQIVGFLLPGDLCDFQVLLLKRMDHSIFAICGSQIVVLPYAQMHGLMERWPNVARALWWTVLRDEAITREWVVNIGQRTANERMAHLFCELFHRMRLVGRVKGGSFQLPLTQSVLADTLGLSSVHTNRTLQDLRRGGLVTFRSGVLTVHDLPGLEKVAFFNSDYLHMDGAAAA